MRCGGRHINTARLFRLLCREGHGFGITIDVYAVFPAEDGQVNSSTEPAAPHVPHPQHPVASVAPLPDAWTGWPPSLSHLNTKAPRKAPRKMQIRMYPL